MVTALSGGVFLPVSILIGISIYNGLKKSWVTSGDIFQRIRYLDHEYVEDIRRINELPLPDTHKHDLIARRYEKYVDETEEFRNKIRELNDISDTNLIRRWRNLP